MKVSEFLLLLILSCSMGACSRQILTLPPQTSEATMSETTPDETPLDMRETETPVVNSTPSPVPTSPQEEVIPIQVIVILSPDVARALHKLDPPTVESEALLKMLEDFDLTLQPMHPDTSDPSLQSYFTLEVPGDATVQQIIDRLQALDIVVAAYVKPPDELP